MKKLWAALLILLPILLPNLCPAGDRYLAQSVVVGGLGRPQNANHRVRCTVGEAMAGTAGDSTYTTQAGCVYQPPQILSGVGTRVADVTPRYWLAPNHPNPFRSATSIRFCVPTRSRVSLKLYDVRGREVRTLLEAEVGPGYQAVSFDGSGLAGGVYYCRLAADGFTATRKLVLLR